MASFDSRNLANKLGVAEIRHGEVTPIDGRSVDEVIETIRGQGLKFLGYHYPQDKRESNAVYLGVGDQVLAAKAWNSPTDMVSLPPKPEGYKDGHRWLGV